MTRTTFLTLAAAGVVSAAACAGGESSGAKDSPAASAAPAASNDGGVALTGAGATFPYPLYSKWITDYSTNNGIKINYQAPEKIEMTSDKNYIARVMENLLSNALKFSQPGKEVTVTVKAEGSNVEIAVSDQGPGLNADDMANLYQKFKKLTPRPTGGESSQGLGLSIVKILSNCMGGDVVCESQVDVGSTFTVTLPTQLNK